MQRAPWTFISTFMYVKVLWKSALEMLIYVGHCDEVCKRVTLHPSVVQREKLL